MGTNSRRGALLALVAGLALAGPARADDREKRYPGRRTTSAPRIDGRLDDAEWRDAFADGRFVQKFPDEARPPSQPTELRVLYDDRALYIAVRCWDAEPDKIVSRLTRRDRETDSDHVSVDIDSKGDHSSAYHFDINAAGVLVDGVRFDDTDYSSDWDGVWRAAASRDAHGWSAELMVPLQTLRYDGARRTFGLQVRRYLQRKDEIDEWAYIPRAVEGEVAYYGALALGTQALGAHRLFALAPYLAGGLYERYGQSPPSLNGPALFGSMGGDLKLGLSPALTFDATVNPDFNQIEADPVVLNLTTFEVFFPEKRPFFLEGFELFVTPLQVFYSRRIGRPPPAPDADSFVALEAAQPGRIYGAVKLTGQLLPRLYVGALDALVSERSMLVARADRPRDGLRVSTEPLSNFAVLRLRQDLFTRSHVGVIATAVDRFEQPFAEAPGAGDACPDGGAPSPTGRCTRDEYVAGADFELRTARGGWGMAGQLVGSLLADGPTRALDDGTRLGAGSEGLAGTFEGGKYDGAFGALVEWRGASPRFDDNELGYTAQSNLQAFEPSLRYRVLRPAGRLLEAEIAVAASLRFDWRFSQLLRQQYWLKAQARFAGAWRLAVELDYDTVHWDLREARDGSPVERAGGFTVGFELKSDSRRRVWVETFGSTQQVQRGWSSELSLQLALRPVPALEIDLIPHAIWSYGDPRWYATTELGDGTRSYFFADLDARAFDATVRVSYAFASTLTLQTYAQLFVASGQYGPPLAAVGQGRGARLPFGAFAPAAAAVAAPDFAEGALDVNAVLRWDLELGSTLQLVYTHAQAQPGDARAREWVGLPAFTRFKRGPGTDLVMVKLTLVLM